MRQRRSETVLEVGVDFGGSGSGSQREVQIFKGEKVRSEAPCVVARRDLMLRQVHVVAAQLNHTNFNAVSTNITSALFGQLTSANDPRIMQLGLKFYF